MTLNLTGQAAGTEIIWERKCPIDNFLSVDLAGGECGCSVAPHDMIGFPRTPTIFDSPMNSGEYTYEATVGNDKAAASVKVFPPDNIVLSIGAAGESFNGTTFIKHNYKFRWGRVALGPCAKNVCVQESLKWNQPKESVNKIGKLKNLIDVPEWWPPCPVPPEGVAGNPDNTAKITWKWDSPYLIDFHGLAIPSDQWNLLEAKDVVVEVKQVVRATGGRCSESTKWELKEEFVFEWVVVGSGSSKRLFQRLKN